MGIVKFIGKKITESASSVVTGAADAVIGATGDIAQTATTKVMSVRTEIHKNNIDKKIMDTKMVEEKLIKLKTMFEAGVLNQAEYEVKKAELLEDF